MALSVFTFDFRLLTERPDTCHLIPLFTSSLFNFSTLQLFNFSTFQLFNFFLYIKPVSHLHHKDVVSPGAEQIPQVTAQPQIAGIGVIRPVLGPHQVEH